MSDIIPVTREQLTDALTSAQLVFENAGKICCGTLRYPAEVAQEIAGHLEAQFRDKLRQPPVPLPMPDDAPEPDAELAALDVILDVLASLDDPGAIERVLAYTVHRFGT